MMDAVERDSPISRTAAFVQLTVVVALIGTFVSMMSAADAIGTGVLPKIFLVGRMAFLVLLCTFFLRRGGESWRSVGLRSPRRWWHVPLLVAGGFVALVALATLNAQVIVPAMGAAPPEVLRTPTWSEDPAQYLFWAFLVAWGSAAFGEELLARGFILDRLMKIVGTTVSGALAAIVLQASIFGALHAYQGASGMLLTGSVGLLLGLLWLFGRRNLWPCIILHGLVDFIAANGW